ncbi:glycosyltransferase family 39 protein [Segnochrobactraceae bacterium EtOH-i3]
MRDAVESRDAGLYAPGSVVLILALLTLARIAAAGHAGLTEDEAYYRLWAIVTAPAYYDHPPMVAWWIALGEWIGGDNALGVRLLGIWASLIGAVALWRTAFLLSGSVLTAGRAAIWLNATPLIGIGSVLMTPDAPSTFFWGLTLWALVELSRSGQAGWWAGIALFAGLGLLSKYTGLFLGAGIVLWLLATREGRRWLMTPWPWLACLFAIGLFLPVIMWNMAHDWASFHKQFGRAAAESWNLKYLPEFIGAQIGLLNPLMVPFIGAGLVVAWRALRRGDAAIGLLLATSLPFLLYLLVHSLHARVQANWVAPLYPAAALLAALAAERIQPRPGRVAGVLRGLALFVAPVGIAVGLFALVHAVSPVGGTVMKGDPTKQLRGWDELAATLALKAQAAGASWIGTDSYGTTGELAFHLKDNNLPVVQLGERIRYANLPVPDAALLAEPALIVMLERRADPADLARRFGDVQPLGTLERPNGHARYQIYRVANPRPEGPLDPVTPRP